MHQERFDLFVLKIGIFFFLAEGYFSVPFSALSLFSFFYYTFCIRHFCYYYFYLRHKNCYSKHNFNSNFIVTVSHLWDIVAPFHRLLCSRKITRFSLDKNASGRRNYEAMFFNQLQLDR